jgi:hypothetical protein
VVIIDNDRVVRINQPGSLWIMALANSPVVVSEVGTDAAVTLSQYDFIPIDDSEAHIHINGPAYLMFWPAKKPLDSGDSSPDDNTQG